MDKKESSTDDTSVNVLFEIVKKRRAELESLPSAKDLLNKAQRIIETRGVVRENDPATGERSMTACIQAFNSIYGTELSVTQGWVFMMLLKLSRSSKGKFHPDDWYDLIAYSALAAEEAMIEC